MAATRGPIPNRSDQRRRTNTDSGPISKAPASSRVKRPPVNGKWHSIAKMLYRSMAESGQAVFMEPSDWAFAYLVCSEISEYCRATKKSAVMFSAIEQATSRLMITEGDRRRLRIELERDRGPVADPDKQAAVTSIAEWQAKLSGAATATS